MRKYRFICVMSAVAALLSVSCSKENSSMEIQNPEEAKTVQISINGEFDDFASTKGSVESIFRMKWAEGDTVYVYGTSDGSTIKNLGMLKATVVSGSDNRVADLSGTITVPATDTKLTLVYSPLFTKAPEVNSGAITQNLEYQSGGAGDVTFIAYATVDYGGTTTSTYRTSFKFATNVLRVNVSGMDKSQALTSARIDSIETACKLTISTSAEPTIEGVYAKDDGEDNITNIERSFTSVSTNASGNIAFYVALPVTTANAGRSLSIAETDSHTYLYPQFATKAVITGGNMLNTIAAIPTHIKYTENSVDLGYGTFIPETGAIWAPVNCGYDATNYPYGKLYQWGRHDGCGYNDGSTFTETLIQVNYLADTQVDGTTVKEDASKFYYGGDWENAFDWLATKNDKRWNDGVESAPIKTDYDPCPSGWRVPTEDELEALIVGPRDGYDKRIINSGQHGNLTCNGVYYDGTDAENPTTGVFLPAAGCRLYFNGNAFGRGSYGYYWSSSPHSDRANVLYYYFIDDGKSDGLTNFPRAIGASVRCVQV